MMIGLVDADLLDKGVITKMNKMDLAYIAGFFDGEGCIHGSLVGKKGPRSKRKRYARARITLGQKDPFILKLIQKHFNYGTLHKYKNCWRYQIRSTNEILNFLSSIYPYLIGKKEQAKIAIKLTERVLNQHAGKSFRDGEEKIRANMIKKITELKREKLK